MQSFTVHELLERYDGFLLDAYGVLVNSSQTLPGANGFIKELERQGKPYRIVSNDGSTTPEAKVERWRSRGLEVPAHCLITPWNVLADSSSPVAVKERKGFVIGTALSLEMFCRAGGVPVLDYEIPEVLVVADELTEPLLERLDEGLTRVARACEAGRSVDLVVVNPDLVYPSQAGYGFTAGALALMFEAGLERLFGKPFPFVRVGKPDPAIFELALFELGLPRERVVMLGDQWDTDIVGAKAVGIDSVLVTTGLGRPDLRRPNQMILNSLRTI